MINSSFRAEGRGNSDFGHSRQLDLRVEVPESNAHVTGVNLTHIIHANDVEAAKGGGHGGGGGGTGGGTTYAPYTSGAAGGFNITIQFNGTWTQEYHDVFVAAADRLSHIIAGDIPNVSVRNKGTVTTIDDITITAELGAIDGAGGILGQAGPTSLRTGSYLPATAQMQFDIADVIDMGASVFSLVVLHEMSHSLGFGSIWDRLGLVTNGEFTGQNAVNAYHDIYHTTGNIAVEQDGGSGTAGSHWDETTFNNELMTGYINDGANPFSAMSAASFADLGYQLSGNYLAYTDVV